MRFARADDEMLEHSPCYGTANRVYAAQSRSARPAHASPMEAAAATAGASNLVAIP